MTKTRQTLQLSKIVNLEIWKESNLRSVFAVSQESFVAAYEDRFNLIKFLVNNPLSFLNDQNDLNDVDGYLNTLLRTYKETHQLVTLNLPVKKNLFGYEIDEDLFAQHYSQIQNKSDHEKPTNLNYLREFAINNVRETTKNESSPESDFSFHLTHFRKIVVYTNDDSYPKLILSLLNVLSIWFGSTILDLWVIASKPKRLFVLAYKLLVRCRKILRRSMITYQIRIRPLVRSKGRIDRNEEFDISVKHKISSDNWLSDEHVYKFARKEQSRLNKFQHLLMSSPIYLNTHHWPGFIDSYVATETLKILVIILVNGNHWVLGSINLEKKVIAIFDSMGNTEHTQSFRKLYMIANLAFRKLESECNLEEFSFYLAHDYPRQENGNDCGVFVCRCIQKIFTRDPKMFTIKTGEYRKELIKTLDNKVQIIDPPSGSIVYDRSLVETSEQIIESLGTVQISINYMNFDALIKEFF